MKIYTRTGDKGKTGLFGGTRISKSSLRLHAYGTIDELNACLGIAASDAKDDNLVTRLMDIQRLLFVVGADLATPSSIATTVRLDGRETKRLEEWIDAMEATLPALQTFILPSGSRIGATLHQARTICRRAERMIVELQEREGNVNPDILRFINRLSDALFVAARFANAQSGTPETLVEPRKEALSTEREAKGRN